MNVLSIQSHVAYGHVGNDAAMFPLQRLGLEAWAIHTVQFSNHTGYGAWRGQVFTGEMIREVLDGMGERGALGQCDGVLSGYVGDVGIGTAVRAARDRVKQASPKALYCCDPVMGDVGRGIFVRPDIPAMMGALLVPAADMVTPNHFELELLTGHAVHSLADALDAASILRARGPEIVVVTSLRRSDAPADMIECLAVTGDGAWLVSTPLIPLDPAPNGCGDALSALFLGHVLLGLDPAEALSKTVSGIHAMLRETHLRGSREIQLIAAQEELVRPGLLFPPRKVA
jgi:pyridoxine kinase